MKITPLISHAAARLPQVSDLFAGTVTADITATAGDVISIVCDTPHGLPVGQKVAVCISNARVELPIFAASDIGNDEAKLEFATPHGLVDLPTIPRTKAWNPTLTLAGFDDPLMNGVHEFKRILSANEAVIVLPNGADPAAYTAPYIIEEHNTTLNGWRPVDVIDETTLEAPAGSLITRDCQANGAKIAVNIRIWGAIDFDQILNLYTQENSAVNDLRMFISPVGTVAMSKDRNAKSSSVAEISPGVHFRQVLMDGFHVVVVVPTHDDMGSIRAADLINGPVLSAVLKTFQGLRLTRPDLPGATSFAAILKQHSGRIINNAYYVHEFEFEAPAILSNAEAINPSEMTTGGLTETVDDPEAINDITPAEPTGSTPFGEISFDGIYNGDFSQPLTARIPYEN